MADNELNQSEKYLYQVFISDGDIYAYSPENRRHDLVGVTKAVYNSLFDRCEDYKDRLIKAGLESPPPPSPEETLGQLNMIIPDLQILIKEWSAFKKDYKLEENQ